MVLNDIARSVVQSVRVEYPEYVFTFQGHRVDEDQQHGLEERQETGRVPAPAHDLKHNFGRHLRAARVSYEDRQDFLGHRSGRITTHYSVAELSRLLASAKRICASGLRRSPALFVLKRAKSV